MENDFIKWIIFGLGTIFFLGCACANASVFMKWILQKKGGSTIPLIGGAIGSFSFWISPINWLHLFWWLPFILDASYLLLSIGIFKSLFYREEKGDKDKETGVKP